MFPKLNHAYPTNSNISGAIGGLSQFNVSTRVGVGANLFHHLLYLPHEYLSSPRLRRLQE